MDKSEFFQLVNEFAKKLEEYGICPRRGELSDYIAEYIMKKEAVKPLEGLYTWDDIYDRAMNTGFGDYDLKVKDEARYQMTLFLLEKEGVNVDEEECPEDSLDEYDTKYHFQFDERGNIVYPEE